MINPFHILMNRWLLAADRNSQTGDGHRQGQRHKTSSSDQEGHAHFKMNRGLLLLSAGLSTSITHIGGRLCLEYAKTAPFYQDRKLCYSREFQLFIVLIFFLIKGYKNYFQSQGWLQTHYGVKEYLELPSVGITGMCHHQCQAKT